MVEDTVAIKKLGGDVEARDCEEIVTRLEQLVVDDLATSLFVFSSRLLSLSSTYVLYVPKSTCVLPNIHGSIVGKRRHDRSSSLIHL